MSWYVLSLMPTTVAEWCGVGEVILDTLPDHVLLQIFSFCREGYPPRPLWWRPLVHVCRRWRQIVFTSPRSLHLVIFCDPRTPVRKSLNIWPPFLISVRHDTYDSDEECENTVAALELRDRVSEISIDCLGGSILERFTAAMLEPFPELAYLYLGCGGDIASVLPHAFLGGFAPSLQSLALFNVTVAFPALSVLLLSATRLTSLQLWDTPITGYISPEAMATCLVTLPNLEVLCIEFQSYPDHISSSSLTRAILPSLTSFRFAGVGEYSENLFARIDAPILRILSITFFDVVFRIPQLNRFLSCAEKFEPPDGVVVEFDDSEINLKFIPSDNFKLTIECDNLVGQVSSIAAICRELSPLLSRVERLDLHGKYLPLSPFWQDDTVPVDLDWLGLFYPFITVQNLYVSKKLGQLVIPTLAELTTEGAKAVFPNLRTLFLEELQPSGSARDAIEAFVATPWFSDHPVAFQQRLPLDSDASITLSPCSWPAWYWDPTSDD